MKAAYQLSAADVLRELNTTATGLSNEAATERQKQYGENRLEEVKPKSKLSIFLSQFADIMIIILVIAAVISFGVGEETDAFVILAIIIGNSLLGYSQESKAEESMRMLKKMTPHHAIVLRDNYPAKIHTRSLVPGDIILLDAGDNVPADARLLQVHSLKTQEASLTGESHSIEKNTQEIAGEDLVPGDQLNMVFKGTFISNGSGKAVVTATGMNTELGKIAGMMDAGVQKTPLQQRLTVFSKQLAVIVIVICLLVFVFGLWRGEPPFNMFLTALSLAVAALPEALPAVITIALSRGARRMVQQKALVRKLPAVETLGSVTYICTDKTGTLTQNIMKVDKLNVEEGKELLMSAAMMLNNEVRFAGSSQLLGDSTEIALVQYSINQGFSRKEMEEAFPLVAKLPFDSQRMRMSTLHNYKGKWIMFIKGAPIKMLERLENKYDVRKDSLEVLNSQWAADGLRVLCFAYRLFEEEPSKISISLEQDFEYLGMVAMIDPPREEVIDSLKQSHTAGIKTVMITGDQLLTAKAIAGRLNIIGKAGDNIMTGAEMEKLSEETFFKNVRNISVYARVSPEQKLRIVKALQANNEFVAMTGDGVNDAPSLKQADIGIAMGITGTDVAKEASDMILLDDNFATIVKAIREGRRIYENIRKFILYVLSCNISEILTILLAPLFGFINPLLPIHILWINLVTDGLPGIALVSEKAEKNIMNRPPTPPKENLFAGGMLNRLLLSGFIMTLASLVVLWLAESNGYNERTQQTMVFTTLCFVQLGNALSVRSFYNSVFSAIFSNRPMWVAILVTVALQFLIIYLPALESIFKTSSLDRNALAIVLIATMTSVACIELLKYISKKTSLH